jgi:lactate dehydrogenase-like 2-hydroxyacid dehydrogenase
MAIPVLWPAMRWPDDRQIEIDALGPHFTAEFAAGMDQVDERQWRTCQAVVSQLDVPARYQSMLDACRIFVTPKVGFDNIDLERWAALGIPVCNVPDYGTMEVADHAIALMLDLLKGVTFHTTELRRDPRGNWRPALNPFGRRLSACTLGIVGLGRIGIATALRARAFGMRVLFFDPYVPNGVDLAIGVHRVRSLRDVFAASDVVSLHAPLTGETRHMVDAATLAAAKPGLVLVNTARGELIDLDALGDAMRDDRIRAAGLDVLPEEPANPAHPLIAAWAAGEEWIRHRLLLTPHSAFFTPESMRDMRAKGAEVAVRYLRDGVLENCVNRHLLASGRCRPLN